MAGRTKRAQMEADKHAALLRAADAALAEATETDTQAKTQAKAAQATKQAKQATQATKQAKQAKATQATKQATKQAKTPTDDLTSLPLDPYERKEAEDDLKFRRLRANVILLEAKARREQVNADSDAISLEKSRGNLCYNDVALAEFSRVIKLMYDDFKRLPQVVTERAALSPEQAAIIRDEVESILRELSAVEVDLTISNTAEVDAKVKSANLHRAKGEARSRLT